MSEFIFHLRVYIEDTDYAGIVYHANYLKYYERARSEWVEQKGIGTEWQRNEGVYFPVRSANVEYLKPARLHQQLAVVSRIAEVRSASIIYEQYLHLRDVPATILSKATVKVACVDSQLKPRALPKHWIRELF